MPRNFTHPWDGFLRSNRYLIHDLATLFTEQFPGTLCDANVQTIRLPARSPVPATEPFNRFRVSLLLGLSHVRFICDFHKKIFTNSLQTLMVLHKIVSRYFAHPAKKWLFRLDNRGQCPDQFRIQASGRGWHLSFAMRRSQVRSLSAPPSRTRQKRAVFTQIQQLFPIHRFTPPAVVGELL